MKDKTGKAGDDFGEVLFRRLSEAAEPILKRKIAELGVTDFRVLGKEKASQLFQESMLEAAVLMPNADFGMLERATAAMTNARFLQALGKCRKDVSSTFGAFDPVVGCDAGILFAGFGLPVMPLDRKVFRPLGKLAHTIDEAELEFGRLKTAIVGYMPATAPFHLMVTDCINTLKLLINTHPAFASIKSLMEQDGRGLPKTNAPPFKHGCLLVAKKPDDRVVSYAHEDDNPNRGSAILFSGWIEGGVPVGTPGNGVAFLPRQLLAEVLANPQLIGWLNHPSGSQLATMH